MYGGNVQSFGSPRGSGNRKCMVEPQIRSGTDSESALWWNDRRMGALMREKHKDICGYV